MRIETFGLLAIAGSIIAADDPFVISRTNDTARNEQSGRLQSVFYDLRLANPDADPGLGPMWPNALLGVTYRTREVFWAANAAIVQPPGAPFAPGAAVSKESRQETTVSYRQGLWTPWVWDAELLIDAGMTSRSTEVVSAVSGTYSDSSLTADPRTILRIPLWQERYAGIFLGLGATWGVGDSSDWLRAHDANGFVGQLNWSGTIDQIPFLSARASVEYTHVTDAHQKVYTGTGDVIGTYQGVRMGGALTWQALRRLSIGAGASYESHDFKGLVTESGARVGDDSIVTSQLDAFARWGFLPYWNLTGGVGIEAFTNTEQDRSPNFTISLEYAPW